MCSTYFFKIKGFNNQFFLFKAIYFPPPVIVLEKISCYKTTMLFKVTLDTYCNTIFLLVCGDDSLWCG